MTNVDVVVEPAPEAVKALARHIRSTGRAYALADVARMVLQARDRYQLLFRIQQPEQGDPKGQSAGKGPAGGPSEFFHCKNDDSLWLSRDEAVAHVLRSPVLKHYYTAEEIEVEPPKGNFSVIAVCGMSGTILGPPNHHEYQASLARLHRERFSGMSLERYKSRVEMHRDEETLEKWKDQVSHKRIYRVGPTIEEGSNESEEESAPEASDNEQAPAPEETEVTTAGDAGEAEEAVEAESAPDVDEEADEETPAEPAADSTVEAEVEETAEDADEASDPDAEDASDDDDAVSEETEAESTEEDQPEAEILNSEEELARHFREHYADEAIKPVTTAVVSGNIPGRDLSGPLLSKLKSEVEKLKRGFPLPMIQELCRHFEKEGLRFFKRGKKTLYVSVIRPRAIKNEEAFTDRIRSIVAYVREHPNARVVQLLDALVPDYQPPKGGESFEEHHLTEAERSVLADLRWLTMEGYVIEFPNSELLLGARDPSRADESKPKPPGAANAPRAKAKSARPRRPKKKGRNLPVPNPLKAKAAEASPAAATATAEPAPPAATETVNADTPPETASAGEVVEVSTEPAPDPVPEKAEAPGALVKPEASEPPMDAESSVAESGSLVTEDAAASEPEPEALSEPASPSPGDHEKAGAPSAEETPAETASESGSAPDDEASPQDTSVTS